MEAVGQLTGGVAHDFNNILTIVLANADAIARRRQRAAAHRQARAAHLRRRPKGLRADAPAAGILPQAGAEARGLRPQRPRGDTGRLLRRTLGEHIVVQTIAAPNLWPTHVDRPQVETSLINLCINARDAMPTGGRLTIETRNVTLDRDYVARPGGRGRAGRLRHAVGQRHRYRHAARHPASASSSRSSPPRRWARAPALASAWSTASSGSRTAISRSTARSASGTTVQHVFPAQRSGGGRGRGAAPAGHCRGGSERILVVEDEKRSAPSSASSSAAWATT